MSKEKGSKQDVMPSILPIKRLIILDGLLKRHIVSKAAEISRTAVRKDYNIISFPLRFIKLPAKTFFPIAELAIHTASMSFANPKSSHPVITIGRLAVDTVGEDFNLSHYIQAVLLCKPILDFIEDGAKKLPDFYALNPKEACNLLSGKMQIPEEMLEGRIFPKKTLTAGDLDINEVVKLLEADFPDIYREYAISSFETGLSSPAGPGVG